MAKWCTLSLVTAGSSTRAAVELAEDRRDARELALQDRRDLVALGHDVVQEHVLRARERKRRSSAANPAASIAIGLSASVWMPASTARVMYSVLRRLLPAITTMSPPLVGDEALEEVGALDHAHAPAGGIVGARVERLDPAQVVVEVRARRRVHAHDRVDVRVHLLLHERRMEVAGIEHGELHGCALREELVAPW